ncbi:hypothetical protein L596_025563 [Steinernema carpocapsae]|uniref:HMG box domain-containing protein n=1 Tax=Steinernema carpocapsae TaxID=34508 RepID=A0A4U5M835_STECR|nr:hypothetical protein L596_025563 [Steinernema carpocapsae]
MKNPVTFTTCLSVWSSLDEKISGTRFKTVDNLKRALEKAWKEFSPDVTMRIEDQSSKRLQACVDAEGGHFEQCM